MSAGDSTSSGNGQERQGERWLDRLLGKLGLRPGASIRTDIEDALAGPATTDDFSPQERALLKNVLSFREYRVKDVMVPRADIIAVPAAINIGELLSVFRTAGHSRLPVYGDTLDDPKGMVHIRDFLDHLAARSESGKPRRRRKTQPEIIPDFVNIEMSELLSTAKLLRPVLFAPPSMPAIDLLVRMQATRTHMALVIDEYGGTDGICSIEDLVEVIVGDIEDEHDESEAPMIQLLPDGNWLADARLDLDEASEALGVNLRDEDVGDDVDTIGGLIVLRAGRLPLRGELIGGPAGLEFEVMDADPRRVKRVKIHNRATEVPPATPLLPPPTPALPAPTDKTPSA
jgi:CBS domain containing-hemolysin-like protein